MAKLDWISLKTRTSRLDGKGFPEIDDRELYESRIPQSLHEVCLGADTINGMFWLTVLALRGVGNKETQKEATDLIKKAAMVIEEVLAHHARLFQHVKDEFISESLITEGNVTASSYTEIVYRRGERFVELVRDKCHRLALSADSQECYGGFDFCLDGTSCDHITVIEEAFRNISLFCGIDEMVYDGQDNKLSHELMRAVRNRKLANYSPKWDEFVKIDDPELQKLEKLHPNSPALRRDFYLYKIKGKSHPELATHWNALSEKERKEICPKSPGEINSSDTVKKLLSRLCEKLNELRSAGNKILEK